MGILILLALAAIPLLLLAASTWELFRRRKSGGSVLAPGAVALLAAVNVAVPLLAVTLQLVSHPDDPAKKATALSLGLSEAINWTAFFLLLGVPLVVVAWLVDRRQRRQRS